MSSITVFTFGDPNVRKAEAIGAYLAGACSGAGAEILGQSLGTGSWAGEWETCGSLVAAGLRESQAIRLAAYAAGLYDQDAVGVLHNDEGRTLATPSGPLNLSTADEVWS